MFLTTFAVKTDISLRRPAKPSPEALLEHIERALLEYDAEILERGEGFLTFRVPTGERLIRHVRPRLGGWGRWWPFDYVSSGTLSVAAAPDGIIVSGEVRPTPWFIVWASALAVATGLYTPLPGKFVRTALGALLWVALSAAFLFLAKWQFRSWLSRVAEDLVAP
jgi:hypothetical protein